tara:strand:- start:403 stop:651 length:249 start_codon:yes stop_codon:yes gene_type:complete
MSEYSDEWLVVKTNENKVIFTQVVEASDYDEAINQANESFDWVRQGDIFSSCLDPFDELCSEFGLEDWNNEPNWITARRKND